MKKILLAATCCFGLTGAAHAATATWDFEADATAFKTSAGFEGTFDQVYGGASTKNGITLSAAAYRDTNLDGIADIWQNSVDPFMDKGNAGLGVCSTGFDESVTVGSYIGQSQCSTQYKSSGGQLTHQPSDDNLVQPEILKLSFGNLQVKIDDLHVRNGTHGFSSGHILISTDGSFDTTNDLFSITAANEGFVNLTGLGASNMFWFSSTGNGGAPEIYLDAMTVSSVPVPAALPLLLAGIGGLGLMGRRRRKMG